MTTGNTDEQSIMDSVFSKGSDMGADDAAPGVSTELPAPEAAAPEPKPEDVVQPEEVSDDDETPLQGRDPRTGKFVPVTELVAERKKLKGERDEQTRLRMEAEANAKAYKEQIEAIQRQSQQPQRQPQPQQQQPQRPDPFLDPEGHAEFLRQNLEQRLIDERVNTSEMLARSKHGDSLVDQAIKAARDAGIAPRFQEARHPIEAVVQWHKRALAQAEVGDDLEAFKKRVADDAVAKALANLKATGQPQGQVQAAQRFPSTLADQTATGTQGAVISEATAINDVFAKQRRA